MTRLAKPKGAAATAPPTTFPAIPPADVLGRLAALKTAPAAELQAQWRVLVPQGGTAAQPGLPAEPARIPHPGTGLWWAEARDAAAS